MNLPTEYIGRMKKFFGIDPASWYEEKPFRGIRINTLKADNNILQKLPFKTTPSPFAQNGFYIPAETEGVGTNVFHHAGAYYAQEPSASCAVNALDVKAGDRVLDLCAAPGGKSGQIAERLSGKGLLISNEFVRSRVNPLCSNMERLGVRNCVITNSDTGILCSALSEYFDRVLVDAPCSGEGMMRKEKAALEGWSMDNIRLCANRQSMILDNAANAVKQGGVLVYSTCTFAPEENELMIKEFLQKHDFEMVDCDFSFGRKGCESFGEGMDKAARIFPQDGGEGHFVAKLIKREGEGFSDSRERKSQKTDNTLKAAQQLFEELSDEPLYGELAVFGSTVRILPQDMPDMSGINVIRAGVDLANIKNGRLEPQHGFFMAASPTKMRRLLELDCEDERVMKFLNGQQIDCSGQKGYYGVAVNGIMLGFGKCSDGVLKNHYPKGLRNLK